MLLISSYEKQNSILISFVILHCISIFIIIYSSERLKAEKILIFETKKNFSEMFRMMFGIFVIFQMVRISMFSFD